MSVPATPPSELAKLVAFAINDMAVHAAHLSAVPANIPTLIEIGKNITALETILKHQRNILLAPPQTVHMPAAPAPVLAEADPALRAP